MVTPDQITKLILDGSFAEGQSVAATVYRYVPCGLTPEWIEDVQDKVVAVLSAPFEADPKFRNEALLMGVRTSAWSGFETQWRELVKADLGRPRA